MRNQYFGLRLTTPLVILGFSDLRRRLTHPRGPQFSSFFIFIFIKKTFMFVLGYVHVDAFADEMFLPSSLFFSAPLASAAPVKHRFFLQLRGSYTHVHDEGHPDLERRHRLTHVRGRPTPPRPSS